MSIQGVNILTQKIIYAPTWYGIAAWVSMMVVTFFFVLFWLDGIGKWAGFISWICFTSFVSLIALTYISSNKTVCNQPSKIEYTIEIFDDNAWKELGPNYTVKSKFMTPKKFI